MFTKINTKLIGGQLYPFATGGIAPGWGTGRLRVAVQHDWATNADEPESIPEVGALDELATFVGQKKRQIWQWRAVS
jgi:hypothetical protein